MKRTSPFGLAAKNTLRITQRDLITDKLQLNTFTGNHNLHQALSKIPHKPKNTLQGTQTFSRTQQLAVKRQQQQLAELQVAALDNFTPPAQNEKTRAVVQNIKLRRRRKHLQLFEKFKQDLQHHRENTLNAYNSLTHNTTQILQKAQLHLSDYLDAQTDDYLIRKDRRLVQQINEAVSQHQNAVDNQLHSAFGQLERTREGQRGIVKQKCQQLFQGLAEIAFVLEAEAREISESERNQMEQFEEQQYERTKNKVKEIEENQVKLGEKLRVKATDKQGRWMEVHQNKAIKDYLADADAGTLRWPQRRVSLYRELTSLQKTNSERKLRLIVNLAKQHPDTLSKTNVQKWSQHLKLINGDFNQSFDQLLKQLMEEQRQSQRKNDHRYEQLRKNMLYIARKTPQQIEELLKQQCEKSYRRNNQECKELLKQVTSYIQGADQRETAALQKLAQFVTQVAGKCDDSIKKWNTLSQQYQVHKARILDEDDELVQRLNGQLTALKQQLRQALHHIKLEQVQGQCFSKIDELEKAYRDTHHKNKQLIKTRPASLNQFMDELESKVAEAFSLYDQSKRAELNEKARAECQEKALKLIQQEEKKKLQQQNAAAQQAKKKGGKPPAAKPKDPKKAQAELQQRKKVVMQQIGLRTIQQVKTASGAAWLAYQSLEQICKALYNHEEGQSGDALGDQITNFQGDPLVAKSAFISAKEIAQQLLCLRDGLFSQLGSKRERIQAQANQLDSAYIEDSLQKLDERLREHYPLKGKVQAQIGVVRAGQVTGHKKQYEKYVRTVKEKVDLQTQKFNYLLERNLQLIKDHNVDQKKGKQQLASCKTLSDFQTCYRKAHDNYKIFVRETQQISKELNRLSTLEIDNVVKSNDQFLKRGKTLAQGGQFSQSEMEWYNTMMTEVNQQIETQRSKRGEKSKQVQEHVQKRCKELIQQFDKEYNSFLEQLSAKEGTGKKYGKPKRIAQEKIRLQMNKCEQAQISIDKQLDCLGQLCLQSVQEYPAKPQFMVWRKRLITLQSCIARYARHIQAIVGNCKARPIPRFTQVEGSPDAMLPAQQQQKDKVRQREQVQQLGPLGQQKQEKSFLKFVEDIEKIIGDEARAIYSGDKAKYITGNDRLPDFMRLYIQNMKKSAQEFRQESVRGLRNSASRLSQLTNSVVSHYFTAIRSYFGGAQRSIYLARKNQLSAALVQHDSIRGVNLQKLRPNLANPKNQEDLKALDTSEDERSKKEVSTIVQIRKTFQGQHFKNGSQCLSAVLNHYEMLIVFLDSIYLPEDFVKVAGDEQQEKVHLDVKRLMIMKQKGIKINPSTQRNIRKKWEAVNCTLFNFDDKVFTLVTKPAQQPKDKDKKAGKKDSKGKPAEQAQPTNPDQSKIIQTYKTWRQKSVFTARQDLLAWMAGQYKQMLESIKSNSEKGLAQNESFRLKWRSIAEPLYVT